MKIVSDEAAKMNAGVKQKVQASPVISTQMKQDIISNLDEFDRELVDIAVDIEKKRKLEMMMS